MIMTKKINLIPLLKFTVTVIVTLKFIPALY